jgi:hypothetical protein
MTWPVKRRMASMWAKVGAGRQPMGPRVEEAVGAQGHRAPYGLEEAMWARGGEESEYWHCLGHREEKWLIEPMPHSGRRPASGHSP